MNYLRVLREAHLTSDSLLKDGRVPSLLGALSAHLRNFRKQVLPRWEEFQLNESLALSASVAFQWVVATLSSIYASYTVADSASDELELELRASAHEVRPPPHPIVYI